MNYVDYDNKTFKITCQIGNGCVRCADKSGKLIYITFLNSVMATLFIYPDDIDLENYFLSGLIVLNDLNISEDVEIR